MNTAIRKSIAYQAVFMNTLDAIHACTRCERLPLGPRPVLQVHPEARVLIAGQAPGQAAHLSGKPFSDPSGERLREWLGVTEQHFYDARLFAIVPMAFCYPGRGNSGDLPPPGICATTWRARVLGLLPNIELTVVIGSYAQEWHLGDRRERNLTETVKNWRNYAPQYFPTPHPSPRNQIWLRRNPWFEQDVLPELRQRVANALVR